MGHKYRVRLYSKKYKSGSSIRIIPAESRGQVLTKLSEELKIPRWMVASAINFVGTKHEKTRVEKLRIVRRQPHAYGLPEEAKKWSLKKLDREVKSLPRGGF